MVLVAIKGMDGVEDGLFKIVHCFKVVVVNGRAFQMSPEAFDQVKVRCVAGIPDDAHPVAARFEVGLHGLGVMNRAVVQEQVDVFPVAVQIIQEPGQELKEFSAAFLAREKHGSLAGHGVQGAEGGDTAILPGGRDDDPLTGGRPTACQARIQMELGFVEVQEGPAAVTGTRFFSAQVLCRLARVTSFGS